MIVVDASAAIDWLLQTPAGQRIESRIFTRQETLHAPHLLDLEVLQALRRLVHQRMISESRAHEALRDLIDLRVTRYPHHVLLDRIWQLRDNVSAYEGAYLVLAEKLGARLITRDRGLASTAGHRVEVEVF